MPPNDMSPNGAPLQIPVTQLAARQPRAGGLKIKAFLPDPAGHARPQDHARHARPLKTDIACRYSVRFFGARNQRARTKTWAEMPCGPLFLFVPVGVSRAAAGVPRTASPEVNIGSSSTSPT